MKRSGLTLVEILVVIANYLYLDGHVKTLDWDVAVVDMFPDKHVFTDDMSYP